MQNKPCWNWKSMGIHFPNNIRKRLARLNFFFCVLTFILQIYFFFNFFCGKWAWSPPANATPSDFPAPKSWVSDLSFQVSFASVLVMVLSVYWKKLDFFFFIMIIFWGNCKKKYNFKKNSQTFFNILKEPLLVQKQMILKTKGLILSFLQMESLRTWHH